MGNGMNYFVLNIKAVIPKRILWELFHPSSQYWDEIFPLKFMDNGMNYFVLNIKVVIFKGIFWKLFNPCNQYWNEIFHPCSRYWDEIFPPKLLPIKQKTTDIGRKYFLSSFKEEFIFIVKNDV